MTRVRSTTVNIVDLIPKAFSVLGDWHAERMKQEPIHVYYEDGVAIPCNHYQNYIVPAEYDLLTSEEVNLFLDKTATTNGS